jgi:general secretion pathway protein I
MSITLSKVKLLKPIQFCMRGLPRQGMTLLEVMVAMGIAAIVLVSIYRLQAQSITMEQIARFHTVAPLLAEQLVAQLELSAPDYPLTDAGDFEENYPGYTWELETHDVDGFTNPDGQALLKEIDIKIQLNNNEDLFILRTYRLVNIGS